MNNKSFVTDDYKTNMIPHLYTDKLMLSFNFMRFLSTL